MGVDASYVYGYMAKESDVIWDTEYLKTKFNLEENLTGYLKEYTYKDLIEWLENDEIDDWDDVKDYLNVQLVHVYDESYLYFTHFDLIEKYPDRKLSELSELAKDLARESGVKNFEVFKWNEFGYFS